MASDDETAQETSVHTDDYIAGYADGQAATAERITNAQLALITAQLSHLNQFAQTVRNVLELLWWALIGALLGYSVGRLLLIIMGSSS